MTQPKPPHHKTNKAVGWVLFIIGWIMLITGMALSSWLPSLIEDPLVEILLFLVVFFGFAIVSVILITVGSQMAEMDLSKIPDYPLVND